MSKQPPRSVHWPFEPIDEELERRVGPYDPGVGGYTTELLATLLKCSTSNVQRWRKQGWLSDASADRVAIALGRHPSFFWGSAWFEAA